LLKYDGRYPLSYGTAAGDLKSLLIALNLDPNLYKEHSARRGAATASSAAGIEASSLQKIVGWKSSAMPALYTEWPVERYLSCSSKLHLH
jgi:hypothetical protein